MIKPCSVVYLYISSSHLTLVAVSKRFLDWISNLVIPVICITILIVLNRHPGKNSMGKKSIYMHEYFCACSFCLFICCLSIKLISFTTFLQSARQESSTKAESELAYWRHSPPLPALLSPPTISTPLPLKLYLSPHLPYAMNNKH